MTQSLIATLSSGDRLVQRITLDQLWSQAEKIGFVKVDQRSWSREYPYEVEIVFKRPSGTRVHAKGTAMSIHEAMIVAIEEARSMGG